jgi:hypothetical protein
VEHNGRDLTVGVRDVRLAAAYQHITRAPAIREHGDQNAQGVETNARVRDDDILFGFQSRIVRSAITTTSRFGWHR